MVEQYRQSLPAAARQQQGQQRQIPLNTSISGSGFSHLGTPISATCSGKSGRGSGWPAQASRGPPGTISAGVIRTLQPPKSRGQRGFRRNRRHAQALLRRRREPGSRQRSSNSADARAETHWVFTGIIRGPVPQCRADADQVRTDQARRASTLSVARARDDRAPAGVDIPL